MQKYSHTLILLHIILGKYKTIVFLFKEKAVLSINDSNNLSLQCYALYFFSFPTVPGSIPSHNLSR